MNETFDIKNSFSAIIDSLALLKLRITELQQNIHSIEKVVKKELKQASKVNKLKNKITKKPSGFAKPTHVTKELCEFMNKPIGTEIARTEVTKALVHYIQINKLQKEGQTSKIKPDFKLQNLLGINNEEITDLTFFTMQKYMNKHFVPKTIIDNELT